MSPKLDRAIEKIIKRNDYATIMVVGLMVSVSVFIGCFLMLVLGIGFVAIFTSWDYHNLWISAGVGGAIGSILLALTRGRIIWIFTFPIRKILSDNKEYQAEVYRAARSSPLYYEEKNHD